MNVFACMPPGHQCVQYHRGRKRTSDPLKLDLQMVVSLCAVARKQFNSWAFTCWYLLRPPQTRLHLQISLLLIMSFLGIYMCVISGCALCLWKLKAFVRSPGPGVTGGPQPPPVDAKNAIPVIARAASAFYHWAICPVPFITFFTYCRLKCFPSSNRECVLIEKNVSNVQKYFQKL